MAKYLYHTCPKCNNYLGVVVPEPPEPVTVIPIDAKCLGCGFKLLWRVILGNKPILTLLWIVSCVLASSLPVYPHGGGLDRYGCHHSRKQGGYHCHKGMFEGKRFDSMQEMRIQPHSGMQLGERQPQYRTVRRVVDGDTLVLENKERVRLIGVDTPETKHPNKPVEYFGKEATAFTRRMVQGKRMRLEFDQANAHIGHKDRYRRTLAYVFLEDGTFLNAEIIKQGYGFAYTRFPFKYMDEFRQYEREAREQRAMGKEYLDYQRTALTASRYGTPVAHL